MTENRSSRQNRQPSGSQPMPAPSLPLDIWGATDPGRERTANEDYIYPHSGAGTFPWQPSAEQRAEKGQLLIVADGIGGAQAGREASSTAAKIVVERYYELPNPDPADNLRIAIQEANAALYQQILTRPSLQSAGTTIAAAVILNNMLYVANVGDSRIYLIRNGRITQLTRDHTLTQQKVERGIIRPEEVELDPDRSVLIRSLGAGPTVEVDEGVFRQPLQLVPGDVVLLCSDGLTDMVDDRTIARLVAGASPKRAARQLIAAANRRGGFDNISVVIARVGGKRASAGGGLLQSIGQMSGLQKAILMALATLVVLVFCGTAGWIMHSVLNGQLTSTPTAFPTVTATTASAPAVVPTHTLQPTDTVPPGAPTSTPRPTNTPTPTRRPPTPTFTPTPAPTAPPSPEQPQPPQPQPPQPQPPQPQPQPTWTPKP